MQEGNVETEDANKKNPPNRGIVRRMNDVNLFSFNQSFDMRRNEQ